MAIFWFPVFTEMPAATSAALLMRNRSGADYLSCEERAAKQLDPRN
jgi:hypothetical protein